jgi:nitrate reductase gamma subunit
MDAQAVLLWVGLPYTSIVVFVVGHVWRFQYDRFGWTDEWVMLLKPRALRWGIVLFHIGAWFTIAGHALGILVPRGVTDGLGVSESAYRMVAIFAGSVFGLSALVGISAFLYRRTMIAAIVRNNRPGDVATLALISAIIVLGLIETIGVNALGGGYDYRSSVAVWFRSLVLFSPRPEVMASAPLVYQLHAASAWLLYAIWPFSRLVHVWQLPFWIRRRLIAPPVLAAVAPRGGK